MLIKRDIYFPPITSICSGEYEEPEVCPICKHALKPEELGFFTYKDNNNHWHISALYLCRHCYQTFVTLYRCRIYPNISQYKTDLLYLAPLKHSEEQFDIAISNLSPKFVEIFNQSLAAEVAGFDELAGLGFRKSLEFLIKDYLCSKDPDSSEEIKKEFLGNSLTRISDTRVKTLAERATWIGNDETHYVRKHENLDITDMKRFITAMVNFIDSELTFEEALGISSKNKASSPR